jgi:hypothetical protein
LTWRLDRLLYAGEEPTLERVRLEREQARSRIMSRVVEALFSWQRAWLEVGDAPAGSREQTEARLRAVESASVLDVMTGGWFSEEGPREKAIVEQCAELPNPPRSGTWEDGFDLPPGNLPGARHGRVLRLRIRSIHLDRRPVAHDRRSHRLGSKLQPKMPDGEHLPG